MPSALDLIGNNRVLQEHWLRRIFAAVIDAILIAIIVFIIGLFLLGFSLALYNPIVGGFRWYIPTGLFFLLYFTLFEGVAGRSPGKAILGLKVTAHLESMGLAKAFIRNLSKVHLIVLLLDFLVGFVMDGDPRQRFLDRLAGTTVVRTGTAALEEEQFRRARYPGASPQETPYAEAAAESPAWPRHELDQQGAAVGEKRFCASCGGPLVPRGDGRMTCTRCGAAY